MFKSVYQNKETLKKVTVRRIDGSDCIVKCEETGTEVKMTQKMMRTKHKYLKAESNPRRFPLLLSGRRK